MNIKLSLKKIKDICGTVSFKRGDSFYRKNKVVMKYNSEDFCEATVSGTEEFFVTIEKESNGKVKSSCSCPKLASYQQDCQHIAAVLIYIYNKQQKKSDNSDEQYSVSEQEITSDLMNLFVPQPVRSSKQQIHFENRTSLEALFTCKPILLGNSQYVLAVEVMIGKLLVQDIRLFLEHICAGDPHIISNSFTYNPNLHCFQLETNDIFFHLFQMTRDEKIFLASFPKETDIINDHQLIISPSSWGRLLPLLEKVNCLKLVYEGNTYKEIKFSNEALPLQFLVEENGTQGVLLKINGMDELLVFQSYGFIFYKGSVLKTSDDDINRLNELNRMMGDSGLNSIPISKEQLGFFMEKVVPGLKKLGNVQLSQRLSTQLVKPPLKAKLFLDRVKNRLLAGLEFHYENHVIHPMDKGEFGRENLIIRDLVAEEQILDLMDDSSFNKTEGGYYLQNEGLEYEFLYYVVPKLQKLVEIYATTAVKNRIFRGNPKPQIRVKAVKDRTNWLEFKFEMAGIQDVQIREVLLALEEKRKYYRLRNGTLLSLETREFKEIQKFLSGLSINCDELEERSRIPIVKGLKLVDTMEGSNALSLEESFVQFLQSIRKPGDLEIEVPKTLKSILRDYQVIGFKWLKTLASYKFGGILADDMGLGKTIQSITFIVSELAEIRKSRKPALIICPSSVTYNWLHELMNFAPEVEAIVLDGNQEQRTQLQKQINEFDVIITSYPLLRKDIRWFENQAFHIVFFDEAQAFKNSLTQTARCVKRIQAEYRFALTGTPVENSIEELWSIMHVVFPELFGNLKEFSKLTHATIARRVSPFLLRRMKEDVLSELPEKIESLDSVELLPEQKKLYAAYLAKLRHDTLKHLDKDTLRKNRIKILAGLTRLRQICCHPALFVDGYKGTSAKFEQLLQILEESKQAGRRVLIFSQFTKMLQLIGSELSKQNLPYYYLDGQTPSEERVEICEHFNKGNRDYFLISLKAGGTGINLTGADTVVFYDLWWNPAVEEQAADRAHRMGQKNVVQVIKLLAKGTIEEKMYELQDRKRHIIDEIIQPNDKILNTLTEEDIRELLML